MQPKGLISGSFIWVARARPCRVRASQGDRRALQGQEDERATGMPVTENSESRIHRNKGQLSNDQMGAQMSMDKKSKSEDGCDRNCYLCHTKSNASKSTKKRRRRCENVTNNSVVDKHIPLKKLKATELYENPSGRNSLMAAFFRLLGVCLNF